MPESDDVFNDIGEQDLSVLHLQMGSPEAFKVLFFQYYPEYPFVCGHVPAGSGSPGCA
jgi:hypothetical protein